MTLSARRQLRMVIVTAGVFVASVLLADRLLAQSSLSCLSAASCVPMTLTANLQLTNLHSAVTQANMLCTAKIPAGNNSGAGEITGTSNSVAVVNRSVTGALTASINVPRSRLADPATRTINTTCELRLTNGQSTMAAVASATQPVGMLYDNWHVVAAGSTVKWTQGVTFPDANVP